jgi:hypothetical protein
LRTSER